MAGSERSRPQRVPFAVLGAVLALVPCACSGKADSVAATTTVTTVAPETTTTTELPLTAGRQISLFTPTVGDCFDRRKLDPKKPDEIVLLLDCNLPHSDEIVGVVEVPGRDYPGDDVLTDLGKANCPKQFKAYIGAPYEASVYELGYYTPTLANWGQGIRHVVGCYAYDAKSNKLAGTVKATNK